MINDTRPAGAKKSTPQEKNQGEGDKASAERFNQMEADFVQSERGQKAIKTAIDLDDDEKDALEAAEREGKARAKGEDPAVTRGRQSGDAKSTK